jgi:cytochrome c
LKRAALAAALFVPGAAHAQETTAAQLYDRCQGCHSPDRDRTGPRLGGLFGRRVGSVAGFEYSAALGSLTFIWDDRTLDRFLANPQAVAPGTRMDFHGIDNAAQRRELIAYLHRVLAR